MRKLPEDYVERVYAGWYGKIIGIRHGSNIEGWDAQKIAETYGEITGYLFDFIHSSHPLKRIDKRLGKPERTVGKQCNYIKGFCAVINIVVAP